MEITKEWIDQQRDKHCGVVNYKHDFYALSTDELRGLREVIKAALDALEASMLREAGKDAEIARLTAERDAAVKDLTTAMTNMYIDGRGDETDICWACKFAMRDKGTFPCNSCINYEMAEFTHRGACKDE